jgi:hypothetical protein
MSESATGAAVGGDSTMAKLTFGKLSGAWKGEASVVAFQTRAE